MNSARVNQLKKIVALPRGHELHGHSGGYATKLSKIICQIRPTKKNFRQCLTKLWRFRRQLVIEDLRASFLDNSAFDSGHWLLYQEQLEYLTVNSPLRIIGRDHRPFFTDVSKRGTYHRLYQKIRARNFKERWEPKRPSLPILSRSPLLVRKKGPLFRFIHSPSRDVPHILNHLEQIWTRALMAKTKRGKAQAVAEFEWFFFTSNPLGRCAASIGDSLSLILQIKIGIELRSKFHHMDWEALSRTLDEYVDWRLNGLPTIPKPATVHSFSKKSKLLLRPEIQKRFQTDGFAHLPKILPKPLLQEIHSSLHRLKFRTKVYPHVGREALSRSGLDKILSFHFNDPEFLDNVRALSGNKNIRCFEGRIYRLDSSQNFDWHDDLNIKERVLGLSLNLGQDPFWGGRFEMRDVLSQELLISFCNNASGDAILFKIARQLEHRVTPVEGKNSRIVFAGWFTI